LIAHRATIEWVAPITKQCSKCKAVFPANDQYFGRSAGAIDGFRSDCIDCHRQTTEGWKQRRDAAQYRLNKRTAESRRKARKLGLESSFTSDDWRRALDYFGGRCAVCGRPPDFWRILAADHWIPLADTECEGTTPNNIVPLCHALKGGRGGCNNSKRDKPPTDWLVERFGAKEAARVLRNIHEYFDWVAKQNTAEG